MLKSIKFLNLEKLCRRYCTARLSHIVVAAAVRTPIGIVQDNSVESIEPQLNTLVTEAVIKRAALPKENIDDLHLVTSKAAKSPSSALQSELLRKNIYHATYDNGLEAFKTAIEKLQHGQSKSSVIAATDTFPAAGFSDEAIEQLKVGTFNGSFDAEIVPITLRQKQRQIITLTQDEHKIVVEESTFKIATAIALTTSANATNLNINPLARILNSTQTSGNDYAGLIQQLLEPIGLKVQDIHFWDMISKREAKHLAGNLNLSLACVHTNSVPGIFGETMPNALALQLIHLVHNLKPKQFGCTIVPQLDGSLTAFLLENPNEISNRLPLLTLYTKEPCSLCDLLIEELELNFSDEYRLEKVFIDRKENVRYLRLFRYDIPVLFFNGQFLCMHRLNSKLLRRKLDEIKNDEFKRMIS